MLQSLVNAFGLRQVQALARSVAAPLLLVSSGCAGSQGEPAAPDPVHAVTWPIDNLKRIGGYDVITTGEPKVTDAPSGKAVCFDGVDDGLVIGINPFDQQLGFTIQMLLKPEAGGGALQQVLHIQNAGEESRIIVERQTVGDEEWTPRTFVRSVDAQTDLEESSMTRPLGAWSWVQVTYSDGVLKQYLDGEEVASEQLAVAPMKPGELALGMKLTRENFFAGCVQEIRMATAALAGEDLERNR